MNNAQSAYVNTHEWGQRLRGPCKQHKELDSSWQKLVGKPETVPSGIHKSKTPENHNAK